MRGSTVIQRPVPSYSLKNEIAVEIRAVVVTSGLRCGCADEICQPIICTDEVRAYFGDEAGYGFLRAVAAAGDQFGELAGA